MYGMINVPIMEGLSFGSMHVYQWCGCCIYTVEKNMSRQGFSFIFIYTSLPLPNNPTQTVSH